MWVFISVWMTRRFADFYLCSCSSVSLSWQQYHLCCRRLAFDFFVCVLFDCSSCLSYFYSLSLSLNVVAICPSLGVYLLADDSWRGSSLVQVRISERNFLYFCPFLFTYIFSLFLQVPCCCLYYSLCYFFWFSCCFFCCLMCLYVLYFICLSCWVMILILTSFRYTCLDPTIDFRYCCWSLNFWCAGGGIFQFPCHLLWKFL